QTLHAALVASPAKLRCGVAITGTVLASDGRWLVDADGERVGPFDLVIAADGSVCELHAAATHVTSTPYRWGALWLVREDPDEYFTNQRAIHQIVDGPRHMLGLLPTGKGPTGDRHLVSLFWSIRADRVDAWRAAGLAKWRDTILAFEPRAEAMLDTLDDLDPVVFTQYRDVAMWPWHAERIVFLGDAAHATSPQLGQGANLALIDAVTFADCVAAEPDVPRALAAYTAARRRHLNYYQFATRALTPFFQSDARVLGWLRDATFPLCKWVSPLRRRMVRTMLGIDRGILRPPIPLAEIKQKLLLADPDSTS
ncbi:MAG: NAD(P)/FAD-dependent oxidoreductase, partial [Proteobacteria bacterium]|nr:NAD(P)/FAD-dependent oxidoreductase [Pseudomonadota bacterium]